MRLNHVIPLPVSAEANAGAFTLSAATGIYVEPGSAELRSIGQYLADRLAPATGYSLPVLETSGPPASEKRSRVAFHILFAKLRPMSNVL